MNNGNDFSGNGWSTYSKLVLSKLEDNEEKLDKMTNLVNELRTELRLLQFKSGVWGAAAGMIPVAIMIAIEKMK